MMTAETTIDYMPARMLNEFVYCPRLFFYEHVEKIFVHNRETVEGSHRHSRIDAKSDALPPAENIGENDRLHSRSVMLSSDTYGLIAKMDLIEVSDGVVTPVDYKRGKPRQSADGDIELWDTDRAQLAAQAIVLRENGYQCDEAIAYYVATKQRVRLQIDEDLISETLNQLENARKIVQAGQIPLPLVDSPKCPRCSLVGICLPDETILSRHNSQNRSKEVQLTLFETSRPVNASSEIQKGNGEIRRLIPARDDLRPLYLNQQGLQAGVSGAVLKIKEKNRVVQEVRIRDICQVNLMGNIQLTTQAVQKLCRKEVPIAYFSQSGWFYGSTQSMGLKNVFLRCDQFRLANVPSFCLRFARALVSGKIRNQRTMLQRNHVEPPSRSIALLKCHYEEAEKAESLEQLLGIEGNAARIYFENFAGMIKLNEGSQEKNNRDFSFDFNGRNRRPPRDPVNALLSLGYSLLAKDLTFVCHSVGFDPHLGYYHQPRFGRPSLALDLMEPFRPLIAESVVLTAINTRMIKEQDFIQTGQAVALTPDGRKSFFRAYEQRMDSLVTHPLFGYRVNYRRLLEVQTRLFARVLSGELQTYQVFVTR